MTTESRIIADTKVFVQSHLADSEPGHDWSHVQRVYHTAMQLAEALGANPFTVAMASLLHDVGDAKFHDGDETVGAALIQSFLGTQPIEPAISQEILFIVANMSFRKNAAFRGEKSLAFQIVQDADRLDSIGAMGIARAFSFGGYKRRPFHAAVDPNSPTQDDPAYTSGKSPTIHHFYEKLLLIKDLMNTAPARQKAEERHQYMLGFLEQFYGEWDGLK